MKSWFAINLDKRSTSSARNGRRITRDVSRIAIAMNKDESRVSCDLLRRDADESRRKRATGRAAKFIKPVGCARGSGGLHCLSFVQARGRRLRLRRRRRFRRRARSFLFHRPKLYKFCLKRAV